MKITAYDLSLNEKGEEILVKDRTFDYSGDECLNKPAKVAEAIREIFRYDQMSEERLYCLALKNNGKIVGVFEISHGGMLASMSSMASIFKRLLLTPLCSAFILTHNHPAGEPYPSSADINMTRKVKEITDLFGNDLKFLDHIIIGRGSGFYSLHDGGYI
ncbi:MAG: JAB domain-containing protein [Erysipelotrichaceae bacterium]|nr:JAB domain-containing protein [Erysipelotrichaceae bacterium]